MFSAQIKSWFEARLPGAISHSVRDLSFKVKMGKITSLHLSTYFQEELNIKSTELSLIDQKCVTVCVTEHDGFEPHVHSHFSSSSSPRSSNHQAALTLVFPPLFSCPFPSLFHFFHFLCPVLIPPASFLPSPPFSIPLIFPFLDSFLLFLFSFISSFISFLLPFLSISPPFLLSFSYFLIFSFLVCSLFFLASFLPLLIAFSCLSCLPFFFSLLSLCAFYSLFFNLFILVPFSCPFYFFLVPSLSFLFAFPFYLFFPFYASNSFYYFFPFSFSPSFLVSLFPLPSLLFL